MNNNNNKNYKIEYGSREWYLYHDIDNEKPVIPLILLTCFFMICNGGIIMIIIMWGWYFLWSHNNNEKLNRDPNILERRKYWKQMREEDNH